MTPVLQSLIRILSVLGIVIILTDGKDNYLELPPGELCYHHHLNIQSEGDCKAAAHSLGLHWGKAWVGPGDHPGCLHTTDSRNKVYYNLSPVPNTVATKGYLSICRRGIHTDTGIETPQRRRERPHGREERPQKDDYIELSPGELCYSHHTNIQSMDDCKAAAQSLGLHWGKAWQGPGDHPGCLHTTDSRNKVYYNLSPAPNTLATRGYLSICRRGLHIDTGTQTPYQKSRERPQRDDYIELSPGKLCYSHHTNIKSMNDCKAAAQSLGLQWGRAWQGPGDHPGCLHTTDSRNKVYYNLSPVPNTVATRGYLSICRRGIHIDTGTQTPQRRRERPHGREERPQRGCLLSSFLSLVDMKICLGHGDMDDRAKAVERTDTHVNQTQGQYWNTEVGTPCPNPLTVIRTPVECEIAAIALGFHYGMEMDGPGDWPGCLYLRDHYTDHSKVYFNSGGHSGDPNMGSKYSALCVTNTGAGGCRACEGEIQDPKKHVCGKDGRTYPSVCHVLHCSDTTKDCKGECPCKIGIDWRTN